MEKSKIFLQILENVGVSCKDNVHIIEVNKNKSKIVDYIFIGYVEHSNEYQVLVYESNNLKIHKNTIMKSKNALFFDSLMKIRKLMGVQRKEPYRLSIKISLNVQQEVEIVILSQ